MELIREALAREASADPTRQQHGSSDTTEVGLSFSDNRPPVQLRLVSWPSRLPYAFPLPTSKAPGTVWVLRRAPRQLLAQLRDEGQSFVDIGHGAVRLALRGLLIDRTDLTPTSVPPDPQRLRDPFTDRASLIARTLFRDPDRERGTRELADAAGVSPMVASHVVRQLASWQAVNTVRSGRDLRIRLHSEWQLIRIWTGRYDWRQNPQIPFAAPMGDPARFLRRLPGVLSSHRWALTLQSGASLVAPHAAWDKVHVYIDVRSTRELRSIGASAGWSPDSSGRIVLMQPWYDDAIWTEIQTIRKLPVVSTLQLILDLWHYPVRGREQAEHLLDTHLAAKKRPLETGTHR